VNRFSAPILLALAPLWLTAMSCPASDEATSPSGTLSNFQITVAYEGKVPKGSIADSAGFRRDQFHVDATTGGLEGAVVYLVPDDETAIPVRDANPADDDPVIIDQFDETFEPQVTAVRAGQPVQLTNHDDLNHNVRSSPQVSANSFNVVTQAQREFEKTFVPEPGDAPIKLSCDIHAWMGAWLYVFDHPWFAVTNGQGRATITDIPPGVFRMVIDQPAAGLRAEGTVRIRAKTDYSLSHYFHDRDLGTPEPGQIQLIGSTPKN
jgi:plastocyanin